MNFKAIFAAAAIALAPIASQAATLVSGGFFDSFASVLTGSSSYVMDFEAAEDIFVDVSFSASGLPANVNLLRYGVGSATTPFDVTTFGRLATGEGALVNLSFTAGEMFSIVIAPSSALSGPTEVGFSIIAESAPAPIPLPAAGWMLIAGVAGLAALGRKRADA
ncbi:MAG: VPLPA-CTERM sorting domain-containing protein [Rubrimonas sp.]